MKPSLANPITLHQPPTQYLGGGVKRRLRGSQSPGLATSLDESCTGAKSDMYDCSVSVCVYGTGRCDEQTCENGGHCSGAQCACPPGYRGPKCQQGLFTTSPCSRKYL